MLSHNENEKNIELNDNGSVREVATVAWPIVVSMLSFTAMGVTDTLLVGWIGITELAAVGLATTAVFLMNSLWMGTLHGVKVLSAQATGAGDHEAAIQAGWLGIMLAIPFGFLVIAISQFDAQLFALLGGPPEVQSLARQYFCIRVFASPFFYVFIAINDYLQGTGDTKTPMKFNLLSNGLNIVFDLVLIFGLGPIPAYGINGAAYATVLAIMVGLAWASYVFVKRVGLNSFSFSGPGMVRLLKLGLPIGVRYLLDIAGFAFFTAIVARMGEVELAANQIAIKILSLSFLPGYGISEAATVLTGQYVGKGSRDGVRASFFNATKISVAVMGVFGLVFWIFPGPLIAVFQDDAAVVMVASQLLFVAAFFQVFDAIAMSAAGALNGTGDTQFTMVVSILGSWFVLVPLAYFFGVVMDMGALGAWIGMTFEIIVLAIVLTWRFLSDGWSAQLTAK